MKKIVSSILCIGIILGSLSPVSIASDEIKASKEILQKENIVNSHYDTNEDVLEIAENYKSDSDYDELQSKKEDLALRETMKEFNIESTETIENNKSAQVYYYEELVKLEGKTVDESLKEVMEELDSYFSSEEADLIRNNMKKSITEENTVIATKSAVKSSTIADLAIANTAIAWFKANGYTFSAMLLSKSLYGDTSKKFVPTNSQKEFFYRTKAYNSLKNKKAYPPGYVKNGEFQNRFNRDEADAYYSIHGFTANMTSNRVIINDTYDYKYDNSRTASAFAINACYRLQMAGRLKTYKIAIPLKR